MTCRRAVRTGRVRTESGARLIGHAGHRSAPPAGSPWEPERREGDSGRGVVSMRRLPVRRLHREGRTAACDEGANPMKYMLIMRTTDEAL